MRWPLLFAVVLVVPLGADETAMSPELKAKLRDRVMETLPPAPANDKPVASNNAAAEKPAPAVVVRAGRPIPRLSAEVMQGELLRQPGEKRQPAATVAAPGAASSDNAEKEVVGPVAPGTFVLPKLTVNADKLAELEARVRDIDRRQRSEEKAMEPTWVDAVLDLPILSLLFGGHTAERRAAVARTRVEVMRWEQVLRVAREMAKTPEEKAQIDADLRLLGDMTREWE
ncbi:MAG TPA: hypothetical protein VIM71_02170 [Lacunisphaera sp.]